MEGADGTPSITLQIVEERRLVTFAHALQDREVDLEGLLYGVEDPVHAISRGVARQILDVTLGQEEHVELRADSLERASEPQNGSVAVLLYAERIEHRPQHG